MKHFPCISPHARSTEFTKNFIYLYQDNSLTKAQRQKSLMSSKGKIFKQKEKYLIDQISYKKAFDKQLLSKRKLRSILDISFQALHKKKLAENNAALLIQKHFRGFLARKNNYDIIEELGKIKSSRCVYKMKDTIDAMWFDFKHFIEPVKIIESYYYRYKKRRQLLVILENYIMYLIYKRSESSIFMSLRTLASRGKLWKMKEPIYIRNRLRKIKKKLCLIAVKKYWKKNGLTAAKIIAYARKLRQARKLHPAKAVLKRTASIPFKSFPSIHARRLSMVFVPLPPDDNLLLDDLPALQNTSDKSLKKQKKFPQFKHKFLRRSREPKLSKRIVSLPQVKKKQTFIFKSKRLPQATLTPHTKLERITFYSPLAETLGFKSFNCKIWQPIPLLSPARSAKTPILKSIYSSILTNQ